MKNLFLPIALIVLFFCSVAAQDRVKFSYYEFEITGKSRDSVSSVLANFEQVPALELMRFKKLLEEGQNKKQIKVITQKTLILNTGSPQTIASGSEVFLKDKTGKTVEVRPGLVFTLTPWIMGEDNKPFVDYDLAYVHNEVDQVLTAQNFPSWLTINLSNPSGSTVFNEVRLAGDWIKSKNYYYGLAYYFEQVAAK